MTAAGALLVGGTSSDAGKSLIVAGLCRALARDGVRVAPFKAQNMSNNSALTLDGGEIGRAQALQATACGLLPDTRFNPVLLKPGSDRRSHVIVRGRPYGDVGAADYHARRVELADVVAAELASLRDEFDVVICEGAGSVAEVNLRATDIANMGLARAARIPVLVVTDIDRGGSLAHLFGTLALLEPADQALIAGFVVNKFRGDPSLLAPGLDTIRERTGRPTLGVLPFADDLWIDAEDSLASPVGRRVGGRTAYSGGPRLAVAAIRLPRTSNTTDVEALACEPDVDVTWVDDPSSVRAADLVVLPGSRASVDDLDWLRERGLADAVVERAQSGRPVLGVCGGFQMLSRRIVDSVESGRGAVDGLGLLDVDIEFRTAKTLRRFSGHSRKSVGAGAAAVSGYEIHHGVAVRNGERTWLVDDETGPEGARSGVVAGTHCHGLFEADDFRRDYLLDVARAVGKDAFAPAPGLSTRAVRERQLDAMADLVTTHLDMRAVHRLLAGGAGSMPTVLSWLSGDRTSDHRP
ncbi:cobyric acid synthase [Gordonia liuliyuniae]|uniref:Cobyric acid synthase n=1 Tax=Gordonia liuliyuniae TaxID=2911517 RepID=A0ABS9IRM1_9ACTN|nr:cobyric acid synthase [Gordonia liuliyuniae]MCF8588208.1 cobyric acid synthase [Gordonia liuliyuniae]